jgi:hypothetical protein
MHRACCLLGSLLHRSRAPLAPLIAIVLASAALGQGAPTTANPRDFGLNLAPGVVAPGENQAVTTTDDSEHPVVGRIHVRVGAGAIVLLPNGELVARREGQFTPTDRKFEPLDKDKFAARLASEFPGFRTKSSNHYIYVYDTSDEFQFGTSRILETMLPGIKNWADSCHIDVKNPPLPLVVVMFRTESEFQRYRRMPSGVVAYYDPVTNRVFVYEQSRLAQVRPDLALGQAISTIAHEGVHQILHNIGVQQRLSIWPMWLSEGLAEFFAPTTIDAKLKWKGAGQINDLRMYELEQYVRGNSAADNNGELVEHTVLAGRLTSTGYAAAWALVHYLSKYKRSELLSLVRESSQIGPLTGATDITSLGVVRENRDVFVAKIGDNFKDLESRLIAHLKKQPYTDPFSDAPHFVATFVSSSGRRSQKNANTFHSLPLASKWVSDMREKLPDTDRPSAQAEIRQFPNRTQADAFARQFLAQ